MGRFRTPEREVPFLLTEIPRRLQVATLVAYCEETPPPKNKKTSFVFLVGMVEGWQDRSSGDRSEAVETVFTGALRFHFRPPDTFLLPLFWSAAFSA